MLKIDIIAVGRLRKGPYFDLAQEYEKRIRRPLTIYEIESKIKNAAAAQKDEAKKIKHHLKNNAYIIALDERGESLKSTAFAQKINHLQNTGEQCLQFIIGGADGLTEDIKSQARMSLSLGKATWPHMLARVMLLEQLYRAQQIIAGHPYHRA
jgi:23S rRNA (pseudouridine1915-N3)-methyltransferase